MKNGLIIGDIHAGSYWAAWPRDLLPRHSKFSAALYATECLEHIAKWAPKKLDFVSFMGDLIDGRQGKSEGTGLFTTSLDEQVDGAIELLRPLAQRAKRIFRLDCTPYHGGFHRALSKLDVEFGIESGDSAQVLDINIDGRILNMSHHPGSQSMLYKGTVLEKQFVWSRVAASEGLVNMPTWLIAAHLHFYEQLDDGCMIALQTPPMQLPTPYAIKMQPWRYRSKIGAILMTEDKNHWSGYRFIPQLYDLPRMTPKILCEDDEKP